MLMTTVVNICFSSKGAKVITLLPGSRLQEVKRMVPIFLKTMELLKGSFPDLRAVMLVASNEHVENYISRLIDHWPVPVILIPGSSLGQKYDAFSVRMYNFFGKISFLWVMSGTLLPPRRHQ